MLGARRDVLGKCCKEIRGYLVARSGKNQKDDQANEQQHSHKNNFS